MVDENNLRVPFRGDFSITFAFGETSSNEEIKKKFEQWGIAGHNGIDYGLPEGTEVVAVASGKVVQAGENGDFGISITIQHAWGTSLYAHLYSSNVTKEQEVKSGDLIGLSGETGAAFGQHLHFGIKPINTDLNNGYLGYIDPSPFIKVVKSSTSRKGSTGRGRKDREKNKRLTSTINPRLPS